MLVPLETLPGWPPAPPVSVVGMLLLLVGFPLLMFLIMLGIGAVRPAKSPYDTMQQREALWVGSGAPEAVTERPGHQAAIPAEQSTTAEVGSAGAAKSPGGAGASNSPGSPDKSNGPGSAGRGGASARW
jgi:uncharacterized membrane protein YgcG